MNGMEKFFQKSPNASKICEENPADLWDSLISRSLAPNLLQESIKTTTTHLRPYIEKKEKNQSKSKSLSDESESELLCFSQDSDILFNILMQATTAISDPFPPLSFLHIEDPFEDAPSRRYSGSKFLVSGVEL